MTGQLISPPARELCPGSGKLPASYSSGSHPSRPYGVYGGGCARCGAQVSVTPQWVVRSHEDPRLIGSIITTRGAA